MLKNMNGASILNFVLGPVFSYCYVEVKLDDEEDEGKCGDVEPTFDNPDPVMTAAILAQQNTTHNGFFTADTASCPICLYTSEERLLCNMMLKFEPTTLYLWGPAMKCRGRSSIGLQPPVVFAFCIVAF